MKIAHSNLSALASLALIGVSFTSCREKQDLSEPVPAANKAITRQDARPVSQDEILRQLSARIAVPKALQRDDRASQEPPTLAQLTETATGLSKLPDAELLRQITPEMLRKSFLDGTWGAVALAVEAVGNAGNLVHSTDLEHLSKLGPEIHTRILNSANLPLEKITEELKADRFNSLFRQTDQNKVYIDGKFLPEASLRLLHEICTLELFIREQKISYHANTLSWAKLFSGTEPQGDCSDIASFYIACISMSGSSGLKNSVCLENGDGHVQVCFIVPRGIPYSPIYLAKNTSYIDPVKIAGNEDQRKEAQFYPPEIDCIKSGILPEYLLSPPEASIGTHLHKFSPSSQSRLASRRIKTHGTADLKRWNAALDRMLFLCPESPSDAENKLSVIEELSARGEADNSSAMPRLEITRRALNTSFWGGINLRNEFVKDPANSESDVKNLGEILQANRDFFLCWIQSPTEELKEFPDLDPKNSDNPGVQSTLSLDIVNRATLVRCLFDMYPSSHPIYPTLLTARSFLRQEMDKWLDKPGKGN